MKAKKLKRAVIKEEFVALTGNCEQAVILNQFDYWSHRTDDIDAYIEEEIARQQNTEAIDILEKAKTNGWIYKSVKELLSEIMLSISEKTARRHLITLVEHGWLQERDNLDNRWDKRKQYRYNLAKVQKDLSDLKYPLEGWTIITNQNDASKRQDDEWEGHHDASEVHHDASETPHKPMTAVAPTLVENGPEITTEITTEITNSIPISEIGTPSREETMETEGFNNNPDNPDHGGPDEQDELNHSTQELKYVQTIVDTFNTLHSMYPQKITQRVARPAKIETMEKFATGKYRAALKWHNAGVDVETACENLRNWVAGLPSGRGVGGLNYFEGKPFPQKAKKGDAKCEHEGTLAMIKRLSI